MSYETTLNFIQDDIIDPYKSIQAYKGEYYYDINSLLRQGLTLKQIEHQNPIIAKHIQNIDSQMKKGSEIVLFRGVKGLNNFLQFFDEEKSSPVLVELAFCSASKDINVTPNFVDRDGCCVLSFTLPSNIKRYDFKDKKYESEVLIERNIQFILESDEPIIDQRRNIKIYSAVVKPYIKQEIDEKDMRMLDKTHKIVHDIIEEENIKDIVNDLYEELKEESFGSITKDDIYQIVDRHQHWSEKKRKLVKNKLLELII